MYLYFNPKALCLNQKYFPTVAEVCNAKGNRAKLKCTFIRTGKYFGNGVRCLGLYGYVKCNRTERTYGSGLSDRESLLRGARTAGLSRVTGVWNCIFLKQVGVARGSRPWGRSPVVSLRRAAGLRAGAGCKLKLGAFGALAG